MKAPKRLLMFRLHFPNERCLLMSDAPISHSTALIYIMVLTAASDSDMVDVELDTIGQSVRRLPVFRDFDQSMIISNAQDCAAILAEEEGLDTVLGLVKDSLADGYRDTAYALACDVAVSDGRLSQEELRLLEMIRHELDIDRLTAAAIERGIAALHRTLPTD